MMEAMPYTQSLLAGCRAVGYHAKAAPPTVTMPRLKVGLALPRDIYLWKFPVLSNPKCTFFQSMVSGAIGGFLDVALNFNTQAFLDDNLLGQNLLLPPYPSILLFLLCMPN
jgi:ethanolaminephosphotransferase